MFPYEISPINNSNPSLRLGFKSKANKLIPRILKSSPFSVSWQSSSRNKVGSLSIKFFLSTQQLSVLYKSIAPYHIVP